MRPERGACLVVATVKQRSLLPRLYPSGRPRRTLRPTITFILRPSSPLAVDEQPRRALLFPPLLLHPGTLNPTNNPAHQIFKNKKVFKNKNSHPLSRLARVIMMILQPENLYSRAPSLIATS